MPASSRTTAPASLGRLPSPLVRCDAFIYGADGKRSPFIVIPARVLAAAGLAQHRTVYLREAGNALLIGASGPGRSRLLSVTPGRGPVLQLRMNQLPEGCRDTPSLVAGAGYVMVTSAEAARSFGDLTSFEKNQGLLKEETVVEHGEPVPALPGLLWRELTTSAYERAHRCVDVIGNIWTVAGFELDSPLRVTRFSDGVLVERVAAEHANSQLRSKLARGKRPYAGKRFGRAVLSSIEGNVIRVIAMDGKLALVGASRSLADFGLAEQDRREYDTPATAEMAKKQGREVSTIVPKRVGLPTRVDENWLPDFGFHPGERFSVTPHPEHAGQLLAVLDDKGRFEVDGNSGRAAVDVPPELLRSFRSRSVKVVATAEGLEIRPSFAAGSD